MYVDILVSNINLILFELRKCALILTSSNLCFIYSFSAKFVDHV